MKKNIPSFVAGMAAMAIVSSLTVGALAATNVIEINPVNIMVNGKIFEPKDANGASVPVFAYNGTTYAPLRALGEAFGQKIGYDSGKNIATVGEQGSVPTTPDKPDYSDWTAEEEKVYQEFKAMWDVENNTVSGGVFSCNLILKNNIADTLVDVLKLTNRELINAYSIRQYNELNVNNCNTGWTTYYTQDKIILWGVTCSLVNIMDKTGPQSSYDMDFDAVMRALGRK